jgi:tRNA pseudouridine38-40 synthase
VRVKAVIAYDGSKFYGFQKQTTTSQTVTTQIELALKSLHINSSIVGSGRTDRGVHASNQVIHFDLPSYWSDLDKLRYTLNQKLSYIDFKHISKVDSNFHARFSATKRIYRYIFQTTKVNVFQKDYISYYDDFDELKLQEALNCFVGVHDFKFFHKQGSIVHTTKREIYKSYYVKMGKYHYIYFEANGFLRSQVRMMVEASMLVALNKLDVEDLKRQINTIKQYTTRLAPPQGLYLARIIY